MGGFKGNFEVYTGDYSKTLGKGKNKTYDFLAGSSSENDRYRSKSEETTKDTDIYLEKALKLANEFDLFGSRPVKPCKEEEIEGLEKSTGVPRFPEAYRTFLSWMGHSAGDFLRGSDCFYNSLKTGLKQDAQVLLKANACPDKLPMDAFVFFMHEGYQFHYFCLGDGADPPVHGYSEEHNSVSKLSPHFSDFLLKEMENHIAIAIKRQIDS